MIEDIVDTWVDNQRKYIAENFYTQAEKDFRNKLLSRLEIQLRSAAKAIVNRKPISIDFAYDLNKDFYRTVMWALFSELEPEELNQLADDSYELCRQFGNERLGEIKDYQGDSGKQTNIIKLIWLIKAYNCKVQGIDIPRVISDIRKIREILASD